MIKNIISIDLGATSGRVILGEVGEGKIKYEEIRRFDNSVVEKEGKFFWDIDKLYWEIVAGLMMVGDRGVKVDSIGVDTWGVDFVYIDKNDKIIGNPRAYRDPYTKGIPEEFFKIIPRVEVYSRTGIQIMDFNSLFQLYAANKENFPPLRQAAHILFLPDAITYLLTGRMVCEYSILSTSQFMNPVTKKIDAELLSAAGVSEKLFPKIVYPGSVIGYLRNEIAKECGLGQVKVIAVAGHDTASAVAAIPSEDENFAYLSSGTWSLMGIETKSPIINDLSSKMNFTNEGGVEGTTRFLKNITGMWILEQCRKDWKAQGKDYTYEEITKMAESLPKSSFTIDVDDPLFANPENMNDALRQYCASAQYPLPDSDAATARLIFDSLADKYAKVLKMLSRFAPFPINRLHIIGGGSKNNFLNRLTANAVGIPVIAGPAEATAIGNMMVQAKALKVVKSFEQMRKYIRESTETTLFNPE